MSIMSISIKITTFLRFLVFLYGMSSPQTEKEHLEKRPGAPKRSMYFCENAPERQNARCTWETLQISGLMFTHIGPHVHCVQCVHFLMSGASSYPTLTTDVAMGMTSSSKLKES